MKALTQVAIFVVMLFVSIFASNAEAKTTHVRHHQRIQYHKQAKAHQFKKAHHHNVPLQISKIATLITHDLWYGMNGYGSEVNLLKADMHTFGYLPNPMFNGRYDKALLAAVAGYQSAHGIASNGYDVFGQTRAAIGYDLSHQGNFLSRMFGDYTKVASVQRAARNFFGRWTAYHPNEYSIKRITKWTLVKKGKKKVKKETVVVIRKGTSDDNTDKWTTSTGAKLHYPAPTENRAGTAAADPEYIAPGSLIVVDNPNGQKFSFVSADMGFGVVHRKASHGRCLVFDFCVPTMNFLGKEYGTVHVIPYNGTPIQQLTAAQQESLYDLRNWQNGTYVPPKNLVPQGIPHKMLARR